MWADIQKAKSAFTVNLWEWSDIRDLLLYSLRKSICNINYKCGSEKILVTSGMPQTVILTDQMFFPGFCRFYVLLFFLTVELLVEMRQRLSAAGWYSRYRIFISQIHGLSSAVGWLGARMASMVIGKCLPEHKTMHKHLNCDTRWTRNFPWLSTVSQQFSQILVIFTSRRRNAYIKKARQKFSWHLTPVSANRPHIASYWISRNLRILGQETYYYFRLTLLVFLGS